MRERVRALVQTLGGGRAGGLLRTPIAGVRLFWAHASGAAAPLVYDKGIVLVFQGRKVGFLGNRRFVYDPDNYLVLTLPLPFACATEATREAPLCGVFVDVPREDMAMIHAAMDEAPRPGTRLVGTAAAVSPVPVDAHMRRAADGLIDALLDPVAARVLGDAARRAVILAALRGPMGGALDGLLNRGTEHGGIDLAVDRMRADLAADHPIEDLARAAGMSVSSFHRAFRARMDQTPLQYLKRLRLHTARRMMAFENVQVAVAAHRVGYESASQFSREYKRVFGAAPATARGRALTDPMAFADPLEIRLAGE
jgi:AraC-like DNA-binding protein